MKQAIIVATCKPYKPWLMDFIKSYNHEYDLVITYNKGNVNRYDAQAVITGLESNYDEFLVLHDTIEIKDNSLFDIVFEKHKGQSVFLRQKSCMFLIKYTKEHLAKLTQENIDKLYDVSNKNEAIAAEGWFNVEYMKISDPVFLFQDFKDNGVREMKYGRKNMVLENKYMKKYKGSWNEETAKKAESYVPTQ